ncbi:MAG: hypothetical protein LQ344_007863 [Seirophora lacunosa]|nr:MAG: hypothetical protein LQ344_007863 [Seirophora lacunosa]
MFSLPALSLLAVFLQHPTPSHQVDISIALLHRTRNARDPVIAICRNIPPGVCCQPHPHALLRGTETLFDYGFSDLAFSTLLPNQFGAGYPAAGPEFTEVGCHEVPIARIFSTSQPGAGYTGPPRGSAPHPINLVFAANWLNLRVPVPPRPADLNYLRLQGVMGLVSEPDRWSTVPGVFPRRLERRRGVDRLNSFARQGTAYIRPPKRWRFADAYNISGILYSDSGDGLFKSEDGKILNLTEKG